MMRPALRMPSRLVALAILPALMTGCAWSTQSIEQRSEVAAIGSDAAIVIGKLQIVRNGQAVDLPDSWLGSSAKLHLTDVSCATPIRAEVGAEGNFAWALHPELYQVSGIEFTVSGRQVVFPTSLSFTVSSEQDATYIGTVHLEASIDSGFYGLVGTAENMRVLNECQADCDDQLSALGLEQDRLDIRLMRPGAGMVTASAQ